MLKHIKILGAIIIAVILVGVVLPYLISAKSYLALITGITLILVIVYSIGIFAIHQLIKFYTKDK